MSEIAVVERPTLPAVRNYRPEHPSFSAQLRDTLESGKALSIPLRDGEDVRGAKRRIYSAGYSASKQVGGKIRTSTAADSRAVLVWLVLA